MKKWFLGCLALLTAATFAPVESYATDVKFLEIKIVSVKVWPTKPSGKCWDPCFMKKYKLPARGAKDYSKYFSNMEFRKACTGSKAPDPLVEIKVGKYEKFTTDNVNNQCNPTFNLKKVFRVPANAAFSVAVYDNDGAAKFQFKRDTIGVKAWPTVPKELINGGKMVIKSFGQVEELVLESKVVKRPKIANTGCEGTYSVRVVEFDVKPKKADGKSWDRGFGRFTKPDVFVVMKVGSDEITTPKKQDTLAATFTGGGRELAIKKGKEVKVIVYDKETFGRKELIGETALGDVCTIIKAGGKHTFTNFGQVNRVVVLFTKTK